MSDALNLTSIMVSMLALIMSLAAIVMVLAQKWSTHKIEWRALQTQDPLESFEEKTQDELDEETLSEALDLQKRRKRVVDPMEEITQTHNF